MLNLGLFYLIQHFSDCFDKTILYNWLISQCLYPRPLFIVSSAYILSDPPNRISAYTAKVSIRYLTYDLVVAINFDSKQILIPFI